MKKLRFISNIIYRKYFFWLKNLENKRKFSGPIIRLNIEKLVRNS